MDVDSAQSSVETEMRERLIEKVLSRNGSTKKDNNDNENDALDDRSVQIILLLFTV